MGTTVSITAEDIREIAPRSTHAPFAFMASKVRQMERLVALHWAELPDDTKALLKALAYDEWYPRSRFKTFLLRLAGLSSVLWLWSKGLLDREFREYVTAYQSLLHTILDEIEREHPLFESALSQQLHSALEAKESTPSMTPQEFRAWLKTIK